MMSGGLISICRAVPEGSQRQNVANAPLRWLSKCDKVAPIVRADGS